MVRLVRLDEGRHVRHKELLQRAHHTVAGMDDLIWAIKAHSQLVGAIRTLVAIRSRISPYVFPFERLSIDDDTREAERALERESCVELLRDVSKGDELGAW